MRQRVSYVDSQVNVTVLFHDTLIKALNDADVFLRAVEVALKKEVKLPEYDLELWKKAGLTYFEFIKARKR